MGQFSRSTNLVFLTSIDKLKAQVKSLEREGSQFGSAIEHAEGYYLFYSKSRLNVITPSILYNTRDIADVVVLMMLEGGEVYLLVKSQNMVVGEYLFDSNDANSGEFVMAMTAFFVIDDGIERFKLFTNAIAAANDTGVVLNDKIEVPIPAAQCEAKEWLESPVNEWQASTENTGITKFVQLRQIPQIKKANRPLKIAVAAAAFGLVGLIAMLSTSQEEPAITQPIQATPIEQNPLLAYQGLIDHQTKDGANPLHVINQMTKGLNLIRTMVGWKCIEVNARQVEQGFAMAITLVSVNGDLSELREMAASAGYLMNIDGDKAKLVGQLEVVPVLSSAARFQLGSYERRLNEYLEAWWDDTSTKVTRDAAAESAPYVIEQIEVKMPNVEILDIHSLASLLYGEPYALNSIILKRDLSKSEMFDAVVSISLSGVMFNEKI